MKTSIFIISNFKSLLKKQIHTTNLHHCVYVWQAAFSLDYSEICLPLWQAPRNVHTPPALLLCTTNTGCCLCQKLIDLVLKHSCFVFLGLEGSHQPKLLLFSCFISCQCPCFYTQLLSLHSNACHFQKTDWQQNTPAASLLPLRTS